MKWLMRLFFAGVVTTILAMVTESPTTMVVGLFLLQVSGVWM